MVLPVVQRVHAGVGEEALPPADHVPAPQGMQAAPSKPGRHTVGYAPGGGKVSEQQDVKVSSFKCKSKDTIAT